MNSGQGGGDACERGSEDRVGFSTRGSEERWVRGADTFHNEERVCGRR
jgi:hypothetical protein